jgi:hypothetical protein
MDKKQFLQEPELLYHKQNIKDGVKSRTCAILVGLSPLVNRELRNLDSGIIDFADDTSDVVLVVTDFLNCTFEATPPRQHRDHFFARH